MVHQPAREVCAPIALFVYNRLEHTKQTVDALARNELARESELYIFSDGPNDEEAVDSVSVVRDYIQGISGFKGVTIVRREANFGLARSIIEGVTEICRNSGRVIVLEDDLVTSPYFLRYMNQALDLYRDDERVISIHGWMWPHRKKIRLPPFFLKGADCWGWATWQRGWSLFEPDGQKLLDMLNRRDLLNEFNFNGNAGYLKMLTDQIAGNNDSWAIRWYASAFLHGKLTLHPGVSLVQNIGTDGSGTHSRKSDSHDTHLTSEPIDARVIPVEEGPRMHKEAEAFYKSLHPSLLRFSASEIRRLIVRIMNFVN